MLRFGVVDSHDVFGVLFGRSVFIKHFLEPDECKGMLFKTEVDPTDIPGTLLLVDDQEMDRVLFAHHLRATTCTILTATDGRTAVEHVRQRPIDVLICDPNLGAKAGEDVIAELRATGTRSDAAAAIAS